MTNKIKILIGDDSAQYGVACASSLRAMGFFVITRPKDGLTIYDAIKNEQPDVVIADAVMPSLDAIELIRKIQNSSYQKPLFIITSAYENSFIETQEFPIACVYSHIINGFSLCSARNFFTFSTLVYIWLSISLVASYLRSLKIPS